MSKCIVEVCRIDDIKVHPNADKLELAVIKGWQCVVGKGQFKVGDIIVYFPPDTVLPTDVSDKLGVTQYLHKGRIKGIKLRGEPSFGLVTTVPDPTMRLGHNVADYYHAEKYEPPPIPVDNGFTTVAASKPAKTWLGRLVQKYTWRWRIARSGSMSDHPKFPCYTEIENLRHFNTVIEPGEAVVVTEKIHGRNVRAGVVDGQEMAGSHNFRKSRPTPIGENWWQCLKIALGGGDKYGPQLTMAVDWYPWTLTNVRNLLHDMAAFGDDVILFGEIYGKVQELKYGCPNDNKFAAFDLMVNGRYMDYGEFAQKCTAYGVPMVPLVALKDFYLPAVKNYSAGKSLVPGADNMREGVVVKPLHERTHPKIGRVVLKYVGDDYLLSKGHNATKDV